MSTEKSDYYSFADIDQIEAHKMFYLFILPNIAQFTNTDYLFLNLLTLNALEKNIVLWNIKRKKPQNTVKEIILNGFRLRNGS